MMNTNWWVKGIWTAAVWSAVIAAGLPMPAEAKPAAVAIDRGFGRMPLYFIPNGGQTDERIAFYVQGQDKSIYFSADGLTYSLGQASDTLWNVKLDFVAATKGVGPVGQEKCGAVISYFKGPKEDWHTGLEAYSKIAYPDLWPGIDLRYSGTVNRMKHEFVVHPGADPSEIRMAYRGAEAVVLNARGQIEVTTPAGSFTDDAPVAWQDIGGERRAVSVEYALDGMEYGFKIGAYDPSSPLVIDPAVLVYCGFVGGASDEFTAGIAVDGAGNAYITGYTFSTETSFPVTIGPSLVAASIGDTFVAKVSADGGSLVYCGFIGGSAIDYAYAIAVDLSGNAYVVGDTTSTEATFPVIGGPDTTQNGSTDVFVAKVNSSGTALVYCGYIGGAATDNVRGVAVDTAGNAYVAGATSSTAASFPVSVGPDTTENGSGDAFVAKVAASGSNLVYCGYIGGTAADSANAIAVDPAGSAYVVGNTGSGQTSFPVTVGPDTTYNGPSDAFVAKVSASGSSLSYCGYIGGSGDEQGRGIAVSPTGNAYVTGLTSSSASSFPETVGPDLTPNGDYDAFVAKVSTTAPIRG